MSRGIPVEVKFTEDGKGVKVGDCYVYITRKETERCWWGGRKPIDMKLIVIQDAGREQRYHTGKWWTL